MQFFLVFLLRACFCLSSLAPSWQAAIAAAFVAVCAFYTASILRKRDAHIYVVGYGCFQAPLTWRIPYASFLEHCRLMPGAFEENSIDFQRKILDRACISELSCLPPSFQYLPPCTSIGSARLEAEACLFGAIDELFASVSVKPHQIGVLIVNCSIFNPTPSLASLVVHRYHLPADVKSFSISGMGCAAGVLALDMAKRLLLVHPSTYALVLSTENVTGCFYKGNQRSMLVTNCLFRTGGSAVLVSNRWRDRRRSKYQVLHTARSHMGAHDMAYRSIFQQEDDAGAVGTELSKDLMHSAGLALEHNLRMLAPKVLPMWEIILYMASMARQKQGKQRYVPSFERAFDHICVHAGGKAVVKAVEENLRIPASMTKASYMTLYRFGNVSSASVWYELAYEEAKGKVKQGNRVWQIALGSGFMCCSAVLKALKRVESPSCLSACWRDSEAF